MPKMELDDPGKRAHTGKLDPSLAEDWGYHRGNYFNAYEILSAAIWVSVTTKERHETERIIQWMYENPSKILWPGMTAPQGTKGNPKVHKDGRVRSHFGITPEVYAALVEIAAADHRNMTDEVSWLVMERKRLLDEARKVTKEVG